MSEGVETLTGVRLVRGLYGVDVLASVDGGPDRTLNIDRAIYDEMVRQIIDTEGGYLQGEIVGLRDRLERAREALEEIASDDDHPSWRKAKAIASSALNDLPPKEHDA